MRAGLWSGRKSVSYKWKAGGRQGCQFQGSLSQMVVREILPDWEGVFVSFRERVSGLGKGGRSLPDLSETPTLRGDLFAVSVRDITAYKRFKRVLRLGRYKHTCQRK